MPRKSPELPCLGVMFSTINHVICRREESQSKMQTNAGGPCVAFLFLLIIGGKLMPTAAQSRGTVFIGYCDYHLVTSIQIRQKSCRTGCVIPHSNLQCGTTQPILRLFDMYLYKVPRRGVSDAKIPQPFGDKLSTE